MRGTLYDATFTKLCEVVLSKNDPGSLCECRELDTDQEGYDEHWLWTVLIRKCWFCRNQDGM